MERHNRWVPFLFMLLLVSLEKCNGEPISTTALRRSENATAVLIQPTVTAAYVKTLQARHEAIRRTGWGNSMDHVIFHEATTDISALVPKLKGAVFISIDQFLLPEPKSQKSEVCNLPVKASIGYKSMCWFWYSTAWKLLDAQGYRFVLRVDDDCVLKEAPWPDHPGVISAPLWTNKEAGWVMNGMTKFFQKRYTLPPVQDWLGPPVENKNWHIPGSPCTQIMMVDIPAIAKDDRVQELWQAVYDTNCIYINRWGDLPLWGFTVAALDIPLLNMTGWEYFHGSHHRMVQSGWYIW